MEYRCNLRWVSPSQTHEVLPNGEETVLIAGGWWPASLVHQVTPGAVVQFVNGAWVEVMPDGSAIPFPPPSADALAWVTAHDSHHGTGFPFPFYWLTGATGATGTTGGYRLGERGATGSNRRDRPDGCDRSDGNHGRHRRRTRSHRPNRRDRPDGCDRSDGNHGRHRRRTRSHGCDRRRRRHGSDWQPRRSSEWIDGRHGRHGRRRREYGCNRTGEGTCLDHPR